MHPWHPLHIVTLIILTLSSWGAPETNVAGPWDLRWAVHAGRADIVDALLSINADTNTATTDGRTPLMIAVQVGHDDIVQTLLANARTRLNVQDARHRTALFYARLNNRVAIGKMLLTAIEAKLRAPKLTMNNIREFILAGIANGVIPRDTTDRRAHPNSGYHPEEFMLVCGLLFRAVQSRTAESNVEIVREILAAGAVPTRVDAHGRSPVYHAARMGHTSILKVLLASGGIVNTDNNGYTPLYIASQHGHAATVKLLVENGGNVHHRAKTGATAIASASFEGHAAVLKLLLLCVRCFAKRVCQAKASSNRCCCAAGLRGGRYLRVPVSYNGIRWKRLILYVY